MHNITNGYSLCGMVIQIVTWCMEKPIGVKKEGHIDLFWDVSMNESLNVHRGEEGMKYKLLKLVDVDT